MATVTRIDNPLGDYVRCRTYSHAWDEFYPIDLAPPLYGWRLSLRCTRCGTERHDTCSFSGAVMSRRYIYPEGYAQKGITKVVFREALFQKLRAKLEASNGVGAASAPTKKKRAAAR